MAFNPLIDASPKAREILAKRYPQKCAAPTPETRAARNYRLYKLYQGALAKKPALSKSAFAMTVLSQSDDSTLSRSSIVRVITELEQKALESNN